MSMHQKQAEMAASSQTGQAKRGALPAAVLAPLAVFIGVGALLAIGLTLNPREIPSPLIGLNYKDRPEDARKWLDELGDPYARTGADIDGRVAIDWGVYGVPETFVVDREGKIAHKHIGPVTQKLLDETLRPLIARLRK